MLIFADSCKSCDDSQNTFEEVKLNSWLIKSEIMQVYVDFKALPNLKNNYFLSSNVKFSRDVDSAYFISTQRIVVDLPLANINTTEIKNVELLFLLPDRQEYCNCFHFGEDDIYYLNVTFSVSKITENVFEIDNFTWNEKKIKTPEN